MSRKKIEAFVERLAKHPSTDVYYNQFTRGTKANRIRRQNLRLYLEEVARSDPKVMLVGEAPGYQGSRLTGVPFMSNHLMMKGSSALGIFGPGKGYQLAGDGSPDQKEPSATVVWRSLEQNQFLPVLWAAFPFHPHKPGKPRTNRKPNAGEIILGRKVLFELRDVFGIKDMVAIGNVAQESLAKTGLKVDKIRHPAHGGVRDFEKGVRKLASLYLK